MSIIPILRSIGITFWCLAAIGLSGCSTTNSLLNTAERKTSSSTNSLSELIKDKNYQGAKDRLYTLYENIPNSGHDERKFRREVNSVANFHSKEHKSKLTAFVRRYRNESSVQHLQAKRLQTEGFKARGRKFAKDTPEDALKVMFKKLNGSTELLYKVLKTDPSNYLAQEMLAVNLSYVSRQKRSNEHFEKALDYSPANYLVWQRFLNHNKPRWGGSHEKMQDLIFQMEAYEKENPKLKSLKGMMVADKSDLARRNKRLDLAEKYAIEALEIVPNYTHENLLDLVYKAVVSAGDTEAACRISNKVISIYPDSQRFQAYASSCQ